MTTPATTTTVLGNAVQTLLTVVKNDALSTALPVLVSFLQNIQNNASTSNLAAQVAALEVNLLAALPNLENSVVKDLAALVQQELSALTATPTTAA